MAEKNRFRLTEDVDMDLDGSPLERREDGSGLLAVYVPKAQMDDLEARGMLESLPPRSRAETKAHG